MVGSTAFAESYLYIDAADVVVTASDVANGTAVPIPVRALFAARVSAWDFEITNLPAGVTFISAESGRDLNVTVKNARGRSNNVTAVLNGCQAPYRHFQAILETNGYWQDPNSENPNAWVSYGVAKWEGGEYEEMILMYAVFDKNYHGGVIKTLTTVTSDSDARGGTVVEQGDHGKSFAHSSGELPGLVSFAPKPTFRETGGKLYAECPNHTVVLMMDGTAVPNPYTLPDATYEEQYIEFSAYTIANDETYNSDLVYYTVTIPAKSPFAPKPTFRETGGKLYAECPDHTVVLMIDGTAVPNPYTLPDATYEEQLLEFSAYTIANNEKYNSDEVYYTVTIAAKPPYQTPAPEITTELTDEAMVITATGEGNVTLYIRYYDNWTGDSYEESNIGEDSVSVPVARGEEDFYIEYWATAQRDDDALIGTTATEYLEIPALEGGGPGPYDPHTQGAWLVLYDTNGEEVFYTLNDNVYWDYYYECGGNLNYSCIYDGYILVPIDIATFGNYQVNGLNVKFNVMIDGKRYGPSDDLQALDFGYSYGYDFESLKSNSLIESDNCFTLKLGDLGGGTGTYIFNYQNENGVPVLKASTYDQPRTGLTISTYIYATNKDGETKSFSGGIADLYCDEFGTGDVPFYFYHSNGIETWNYGAETDMLEAVIGNPFAQMTHRGTKKFTVPAGFRYRIGLVGEELYGYASGAAFSNSYLYVQQLDSLISPIDNVTFTVDKPTLLKNDYQTYRARVDFKEEYLAQVSDVKLEFILPYESEFIENSVMVGSSVSDYSSIVTSGFNGSTTIITVPVTEHSQPVRLCATIDDDEGYCNSAAFVIYNMNGETFRRSIGNASFYVSNASISVTPVTTDSRITVYGIAAGGKSVKVYDGEVLIAQTTCLANGSWRVDCNLHQPVNPSVHPIHATISTLDGEVINTETVEVDYRLSAPQLSKVTMCYLDNENVLDFIKGTTTPVDYRVPATGIFSTYFTFVANLKGTTATVHNLKFKILDTKGKIVTRNGNYVPSRNEWVCQASYADINKLPITVGLSYDYVWEGVLCHYENNFNDNTNGVTPNMVPHVQLTDPSGFVYEGVPSNRLEGVTATCYYKDPETDEAVLWDAEQFEQHNPLITDENGYYRWDVPIGQWQVKYEKEGYETTYSSWLPVPPPQLDVNIGMVQKTEPVVIKAHAYPQAVELEFDKYMLPETLTTGNITVSVNGKAVVGTIELLNAEVDDPDAITSLRRSKGTGLTLASRVRFNADQPFNASEVTLHVKKDVTSYADVQMNADFEAVLPLEVEMQAIVADSAVVVPFMGERLLNVAVQPAAAAAGKVLSVRSMAPMIATTDAESYTLDSNGAAVITVHGDLPGASLLLFSIEGYNLTASTLVNVTMEAETTVAAPTASIASGSEVEKGTALYLFCSTPGATIYYTLDGSSPLDNTAARLTYDGSPIIINSDVTIKAMAVADGMYDSEVATFTYHVAKTGMKGDVNLDGTVNIADINLLIDYILRDHITSEMLERGDVNGDNTINIADINEVIQIILGSGTRAQVQVNTSDLLHISNLTLRPGETGTMHVTVDNAAHYSGLQCDIVLPDGLTLVNVSATGGSMVETGELSTATSRAVTYSMSQKTFVGEGHDVLTLTVRADAALASESQVVLTDVVLADVQGRAWYAQDCTAMVNNASGINDLNATGKQVASVRYYNVAGQEMATPEGLTIQVTTYTDGTRSATRLVK